MKIERVQPQEVQQTYESKAKPVGQKGAAETVVLREAPKISKDELKVAKLRAEMDFDRVKEMVRKVSPSGAYPPLDGIDRLSNLFGKLDA